MVRPGKFWRNVWIFLANDLVLKLVFRTGSNIPTKIICCLGGKMTILAIGIAFLVAICFFFMRRKSATANPGTLGLNGANSRKKPAKKAVAARNPWRATSITHDENACEAVKTIAGKRFLDAERNIPKLPLPACDSDRCNCTYARYEDRRDSSEDRRTPNALQAQLYDRVGQENRRARKRGRRKTDWT